MNTPSKLFDIGVDISKDPAKYLIAVKNRTKMFLSHHDKEGNRYYKSSWNLLNNFIQI